MRLPPEHHELANLVSRYLAKESAVFWTPKFVEL
jgi:hypothetical protein